MEYFELKGSWKEIFKRRKDRSLPLGYIPETERTMAWLTYRLTLEVSTGRVPGHHDDRDRVT